MTVSIKTNKKNEISVSNNTFKTKFLFIIFTLIYLSNHAILAQVLHIDGRKVVQINEELLIEAGTEVIFKEGASLIIEGSLICKGEEKNPITFRNENNLTPGQGIVISGQNTHGQLQIIHSKIDGLQQALVFEPFWYRKSIDLQHIDIKNSPSFDPVFLIQRPINFLTEGKGILFTLKHINIINNNSGMLIESFGEQGIKYEIDYLYFGDNKIVGDEEDLGIFHINFSRFIQGEKKLAQNIAFERNFNDYKEIGLSVGGQAKQTLSLGKIYKNKNSNIVFDQRKNPKIPIVYSEYSTDFLEFGRKGLLEIMQHENYVLSIIMTGKIKLNQLLDKKNNPLVYSVSFHENQILLTYKNGVAAYLEIDEGNRIRLPEMQITEIESDTNFIEETINKEEEYRGVEIGFKIPVFKKRNEKLQKLNTWEIGGFFGTTVYGGGDIKHPRFRDFPTGILKDIPLIKDIILPATFEYSGGIFAQYNINTRLSIRGSFYRSAVSMGHSAAAAFFTNRNITKTIDANYQEIIPYNTHSAQNFYTPIHALDFEMLWHLRTYEQSRIKSYKVVPSVGLALGVFQFTPYRTQWINRDEVDSWFERKRLSLESAVNLRDIGTEGQYFLPGMKPYSSLAMSASGILSLSIIFKKFTIKAEGRFVYTSTDYLDDFGPGLYFGGDASQVIANADTDLSSAEIARTLNARNGLATNAYRSTNGLNDWYYQMQLGLSFPLGK